MFEEFGKTMDAAMKKINDKINEAVKVVDEEVEKVVKAVDEKVEEAEKKGHVTYSVKVNGIDIKVTSAGKVFINGQLAYPVSKADKACCSQKIDYDSKNVVADTVVKGDVMGNIQVSKENVTVTVEGDLMGSIIGAKIVNIHGDHIIG